MKNITKPNSLKKEKFNPQTLKPGTTFDDVTRNFLIEESKIRIDNKQDKLFILMIFINSITKRYVKKLFKK